MVFYHIPISPTLFGDAMMGFFPASYVALIGVQLGSLYCGENFVRLQWYTDVRSGLVMG